jgi:hypothetical protein
LNAPRGVTEQLPRLVMVALDVVAPLEQEAHRIDSGLTPFGKREALATLELARLMINLPLNAWRTNQ